RAQIIDKDRNPKWSPSEIAAVGEAEVAPYFETLDDRELALP
ncbi:MAG: enoyl-CoA hydratase/isomerase family protein, partial [Pseudomonadota bacterium]